MLIFSFDFFFHFIVSRKDKDKPLCDPMDIVGMLLFTAIIIGLFGALVNFFEMVVIPKARVFSTVAGNGVRLMLESFLLMVIVCGTNSCCTG